MSSPTFNGFALYVVPATPKLNGFELYMIPATPKFGGFSIYTTTQGVPPPTPPPEPTELEKLRTHPNADTPVSLRSEHDNSNKSSHRS